MDTTSAWYYFGASVIAMLLLSYGIYRYFVDAEESYALAATSFCVSMTLSVMVIFLVPVDIFVISKGAFRAASLVEVSQATIKNAYFVIFSALLAVAFCLVPFAYFWGEQSYAPRHSVPSKKDGFADSFAGRSLVGKQAAQHESDDREACARPCNALRSTIVFILFIIALLAAGLVFRFGKADGINDIFRRSPSTAPDQPSGSEGNWRVSRGRSVLHAGASHLSSEDRRNLGEDGVQMQWVRDILDLDHAGQGAILFAIACLSILGCFWWTCYVAYGLAALPWVCLRGQFSLKKQRQEIEEDLARLRGKQREIQAKYASDMSENLSEMSASDKRELERLKRQQSLLSRHNYRLQELDTFSSLWFSKILTVLVPFRVLIGVGMLTLSLGIAISLGTATVDKYMNSPCGWSCGYVLQKGHDTWNPFDTFFLGLSSHFPLDFLALGCLVLYIFAASLYGVLSVGIRIAFVPIYVIRRHKSMPQALLILCFILIHTLLVLCMCLLTIAPIYSMFGPQTFPLDDGSGMAPCSVDTGGRGCRLSVFASFFSRINSGNRFFSASFIFFNWAFVAVFTVVFLRKAIWERRKSYGGGSSTDTDGGDLEEADGLLPLKTAGRAM